MVQDLNGKDLVTRSFSAITDLSIIIETGVELLQETNGILS